MVRDAVAPVGPRVQALTPLLLLHSFRHLGMAFLLPGVTATALDVRFANPAAYGDLIAALLALLALLALRLRWRLAIPVVRIFNMGGSVNIKLKRLNSPIQLGVTLTLTMNSYLCLLKAITLRGKVTVCL